MTLNVTDAMNEARKYGRPFADYYETIIDQCEITGESLPDPDELWEKLHDEFEFFDEWLESQDEDGFVDTLVVYNERRCIETYGEDYLDQED